MFDTSETRNTELVLTVGNHGNFPPSERVDLGTHFDLVDHLWQGKNAILEQDCRWIVGFRPALVRPTSGVAFAIAMGTNYYIRITESSRKRYIADLREKALEDAECVGVQLDNLDQYLAQRSGDSHIGPSWVTGWFLQNEAEYIREAYQECG